MRDEKESVLVKIVDEYEWTPQEDDLSISLNAWVALVMLIVGIGGSFELW